MPDITMCRGVNCPLKDKCYRFMAKPDDYQAYFAISPIKDGKCDYYWVDSLLQRMNLPEDKDDAQ